MGALAGFPSLIIQEGGQKVGSSQQRRRQKRYIMPTETNRLKGGLPKCLGKVLGVENLYCSPEITANPRYWAAHECHSRKLRKEKLP